VILGTVNRKNGKCVPIIGVPGYPVSSAMTADLFLPIFMNTWYEQVPRPNEFVEARCIRNVVSPAGDDDFVRVVIGNIRGEMITLPLSRGAGVISSLVKADGYLKIEAGSQGVRAGEKVHVQLLRHRDEIERTILSVGSHDITLDVLAQFLAKRKRRLSAAHVGSIAGLIAINRRETHISQSHLYDTETEEYNVPFINKYIKDEKIKLIEFVSREQGFLVPKGNPKKILGFDDLHNTKLRFVNRQRGAGTRVLFDSYLKAYGIEAETLLGYDDEEFSHLSVGVAVKSGRVDFGMGIAAAAYAMDLDFVPICEEKYQLVIPADLYESDLLTPLLEILNDKEFQQVLKNMNGYHVGDIGKIVYES
jgi:putative molybdopterin biosynthesis protein